MSIEPFPHTIITMLLPIKMCGVPKPQKKRTTTEKMPYSVKHLNLITIQENEEQQLYIVHDPFLYLQHLTEMMIMKKMYEKKLDGYAKQVSNLITLLQKSNIDIPSTSPRASSSSSFQSDGKDIGKGHALCATTTHSSRWLLDLGASHHMASSQGLFSYFEASPTPHILMGNDTIMIVCGKYFYWH